MRSKIKNEELKYKLNLIQIQREFKEGKCMYEKMFNIIGYSGNINLKRDVYPLK